MLPIIVLSHIISAGYAEVTLFKVTEVAKHSQETTDLISSIRRLHYILNSSSHIL
jgi:hypothetical protein